MVFVMEKGLKIFDIFEATVIMDLVGWGVYR